MSLTTPLISYNLVTGMTIDTTINVELFPSKILVDAGLIKVSQLPDWIINKPL
jgi:hypothetical protein